MSTELEGLVADSGLSTADFAQGIGVSRSTLWKYRQPGVEVPAATLRDAQDLAAMAAAHRRSRMEATVCGEDPEC